jgi:hypothetical protein
VCKKRPEVSMTSLEKNRKAGTKPNILFSSSKEYERVDSA